jgi:tellurite resistance protein TehA-like permease
VRARLHEGLATLPPAYFAMVMATGIVTVAAHLEELEVVSHVLSFVNLVAFAVLWVLFVLRLAWFPSRVSRDFVDFHRGPGFFTVVAGTAVVGTQLIVIHGRPLLALSAWLFALPLWFAITYGVFAGFTTADDKPTLGEGIDGGWLTAVVATQSISVLGTLVSPTLSSSRMPVLFISLSAWLYGGMLYIWLIALIFYRYTFFRFVPNDLTPPYWINMGAMAISTLAGALLVEHAQSAPFLAELTPFLKGFTMLFWATATWWIPMLGILGYWRHIRRGFALAYDPLYWGAVFPLGMYTVCTIHVSRVMGVPFLLWIPHLFVWIARTAWASTTVGLLRRLWRTLVVGSHLES